MAVATAAGRLTLGKMTLYVVAFRQGQQAFQTILAAIGGMYEDNLYMSNLFEYLAIPTGRPRAAARARRAARGGRRRASASRTWASATPAPRAGRSGTCRSSSPAGRAWRSSARTARARRRSSSSSPGSTSRPRGASCSTDGTSATWDEDDAPPAHRRHLPGLQPVPVPLPGERRASAASSTPRTRARLERAVGRGGADEVIRTLPAGLETPLGPLVQGGHRALRRPVAEGRARPGVHARGGGHPGARRAHRRARRRGRARHLRALPAARPRAAPRSSSRTASPPCAWRIASSCIEQGKIVEQGTHEELMALERPLRAPLHAAGEGLPVSVRAVVLRPALGPPRQLVGLGRGGGLARACRRSVEPGAGATSRSPRPCGGYRPYLALVGQAAREVGPAGRRPRDARACAGRSCGRGRTSCRRSARWSPHRGGHQLLDCPRAPRRPPAWASVRRGGHRRGGRSVQAGPGPVSPRLRAARAMRRTEVAFVAGSPFDARGALASGFQVTWVNRLGAPVQADLSGVRVVSGRCKAERWRAR